MRINGISFQASPKTVCAASALTLATLAGPPAYADGVQNNQPDDSMTVVIPKVLVIQNGDTVEFSPKNAEMVLNLYDAEAKMAEIEEPICEDVVQFSSQDEQINPVQEADSEQPISPVQKWVCGSIIGVFVVGIGALGVDLVKDHIEHKRYMRDSFNPEDCFDG